MDLGGPKPLIFDDSINWIYGNIVDSWHMAKSQALSSRLLLYLCQIRNQDSRGFISNWCFLGDDLHPIDMSLSKSWMISTWSPGRVGHWNCWRASANHHRYAVHSVKYQSLKREKSHQKDENRGQITEGSKTKQNKIQDLVMVVNSFGISYKSSIVPRPVGLTQGSWNDPFLGKSNLMLKLLVISRDFLKIIVLVIYFSPRKS